MREIKQYIEANDLKTLQDIFADLQEDNYIHWDILFKDAYIHACLKNRPEVIEWLETLFKELNPLHQIALKPVFAYGRTLLRKSQGQKLL